MSNLQEDLEKLCKIALKFGAEEAKTIKAEDVVVADWVRLKCQYGCDGYSKSLTCPPYSPTPDQTRRMLSCYKYAILVRFPPDSDIHRAMAKLEREAFLSGYHPAFAMVAGPCTLCDECSLDYCRHPELARPSMEACGIDVYSTVRRAGFNIHVLRNRSETPSYYALLLIT